ncbi:hypothetical protein FSB08_37200 [Paraburkholderia sp. JPY432]|nr:hypothetical protein [Paraburkholderia youngii]
MPVPSRSVLFRSEFNVLGQKLYLSPVLDLYNGEIMAYQMNARPLFELARGALSSRLNRVGAIRPASLRHERYFFTRTDDFSFSYTIRRRTVLRVTLWSASRIDSAMRR